MEELEDEIKDSINDSEELYSIDNTYEDEYFDIFLELEEEFMDFMDRVMFDDSLDEEIKRKYLMGVKNLINEISALFNNLKSKKEFEKEILLDLVNAYGIDQIKLKKRIIFSNI